MTPTAHEKVRTNVYLDAEMKEKAKEIFKEYGMGLSDAFNIFLSQTVMERGIPFEVKIPNKQTAGAIKDAREGKNMTKISLDGLKKEIGA
ncbi:MAG: type II toxin-antitoxin system RelB/DinJ family antitoxin [Sulfurovum sp.]|nr:type II toxin-antitoxin system RelB/DinJ family antitoxin [Sulfurovum sp.]